jgi:7-cyano-7-deazaguanine synthase
MMKDKALVILSGGQDSTICLYWAKANFKEVRAISFDYGQRHSRELAAAIAIAGMANVEHELIPLGRILQSTSPLVSSSELETYKDFDAMEKVIGSRVELTFVPMRNMLFLVVAANRAFALGYRTLVLGVSQQDADNYPDCRPAFINAAQDSINDAFDDGQQFIIRTPLMHMSKGHSVKLAEKLPGCMEALAYSHTCYAGEFPPCGKCHSCVLRAKGFEDANVADPLVVRGKKEGVSA